MGRDPEPDIPKRTKAMSMPLPPSPLRPPGSPRARRMAPLLALRLRLGATLFRCGGGPAGNREVIQIGPQPHISAASPIIACCGHLLPLTAAAPWTTACWPPGRSRSSVFTSDLDSCSLFTCTSTLLAWRSINEQYRFVYRLRFKHK